jgi:hypothetical protein
VHNPGLEHQPFRLVLQARARPSRRKPSPLGLQAIVQDFAEKAKNLTQGLSGGRLRAIQGIARAVA